MYTYRASSDSAIHSSVTTTSAPHLSGTGSMLLSNGPSEFFLSSLSHSFHVNYTHTHPFNSPSSGTTRVSWYQKGKTNLDFTEARDSEWQWNQLGHMQVCTSLQTDNHASTPPPNQQCQSTEGNSCKL